jgi:hypothetical protein
MSTVMAMEQVASHTVAEPVDSTERPCDCLHDSLFDDLDHLLGFLDGHLDGFPHEGERMAMAVDVALAATLRADHDLDLI